MRTTNSPHSTDGHWLVAISTSKKTLSDPEARRKMPRTDFESAQALQSERLSELDQMPESDWRCPTAKDIARRMDHPIFYLAGYDLGSSQLHPRAGNGKGRLCSPGWLKGRSTDDDDLDILHNSFFFQSALLKLGLRSASVGWINFVQDFLKQSCSWLGSGSLDYLASFASLNRIPPDFPWCMPCRARLINILEKFFRESSE